MKKVFLSAYLNGNFGDDLFLKILLDRYPNIMFYSMSNFEYTKYKNLHLVKYKKVRLINKIIKILSAKKYSYENLLSKNCDIILMLGGSMFIENKSEHNLSLFENKKYYILGSNFGPYYTEEFCKKYDKLFSGACDVCFRDNYSYNLFKHLNHVRKASDIVFSLDVKKYLKQDKIISISVIDPDLKLGDGYRDKYFQFLNSIISYFSDKNYKIKLLSFCQNEGDEHIADILYDKNKNKNIEKIYYDGNMDKMLYVLGSSEYIVGSRFHANIIGLAMKKKIIPIAYSDKTINFLRDVGFDKQIYDIRNLSDYKHTEYEFMLDTSILNDATNHFKKFDIEMKGE